MADTHYMYVLECADGSLYTGYAVDVQARLAVHNAGRGAKYTRARLPVSLLAFAEFPTKHDAMHAEYVFKQLTRNEKDALLARASHSSLAEALAELLE
ncbi:GIY-YIG nuclease family protein [Adlercreutzia mucosicola]|uniref:GIY-YIG nuclease family protein n=1 Tax=Adlercreutzia mucosicola TaxID=580026 RepID=UPI0004164F95|nr:GIY-YIG nuclease family protein [Adlercreutzia mucosicola]MCR2033893.1 GIY-YIG nuclease family protein [Adlercreutzia mucosicola]